ncbi:phosphotransferase [Nitrospirillum sp. BR 11164]|uniref:aminoglycoside phosphotransferase family protein n=1 Tax=Nitrospirillum sp. BR 11164 TaxID=3104324 RepID=UPI002AFF2E06|nr:phosphotransferase [Nitrospirillum sp. BR 11164]MEA1649720.1 phosphotransferase [Nitrospirillum sp. BR 11164]
MRRDTPPRETVIRRFLDQAGWGAARRQPMGADWSARRYERLTLPGTGGGGATAILMDCRDEVAASQVPPFVQIAGLLRDCALSAPVILAGDEPQGLLLIEDFGGDDYARLLDGGEEPWQPLYEVATDVLVTLHQRFVPASAPDLSRYDVGLFRDQVMLFADAFAPVVRGRALPAGAWDALAEAWEGVLPAALSLPPTLLLRDYHPGNLMRLKDRAGVAACGLLDFQDGGIGPRAYDLVSLLEDARRDVPEDLRQAMTLRYLAAFPGIDQGTFRASAAILGAVRHARILGRVAQLIQATASAPQLSFLPRVWGQFTGAIRHPALSPIAHWVERHLPANLDADTIVRSF